MSVELQCRIANWSVLVNEYHYITLSGILVLVLHCDLIGRSKLLDLAQGFGHQTPSPRLSRVGSGHETRGLVSQVQILGLAPEALPNCRSRGEVYWYNAEARTSTFTNL